MKKLSVHLSLLCLLALLLVPFAGCKDKEEATEETPATSPAETPAAAMTPETTPPASSDMTTPATSDATTPPAGK